MLHSSKVLTVSYGTFSCTLEGFDDPVETMKVVAEYFRELSNRDRYFGSEPPTPDPAVLNRLASETIRRPVETEELEDGVILRPAAGAPAAETSVAESGEEEGEEAAPILFHSHRRTTAPGETRGAEAPSAAVGTSVGKEPAAVGKEDALSGPAPQAEGETVSPEPEAAKTAARATSIPPHAAAAAPVVRETGAEAAHRGTGPATAAEDTATHDDIPARVAARIRRIREALDLQTDTTEHATDEPADAAERRIVEAQPVDMPEAEGTGTPADTRADGEVTNAVGETAIDKVAPAGDDGKERTSAPAGERTAGKSTTEEAEAESAEETPATGTRQEAQAARSDNILVLTREMARGRDRAPAEETPGATAAAMEDGVKNGHEEEAEVLAAALRDEAEKAGRSAPAGSAEEAAPALSPRMERRIRKRIAREELALQRLLEAADKRMNQAEIARKRDEIRHLKAAIAATRSDESLAPEHRSRKGAEKVSEFRRHLAEIESVRPASGDPASGRPPLVLVEPIRAGKPVKAVAAPAEVAAPSKWELALSESASFERFIAAIEVTSVEALIEAAAAWITYGEGRTRFTRLEITEMIAPICEDFGIQREEVLRAFGQLLREGALARVAPGDFAMTKRSHFVRGMPLSA